MLNCPNSFDVVRGTWQTCFQRDLCNCTLQTSTLSSGAPGCPAPAQVHLLPAKHRHLQDPCQHPAHALVKCTCTVLRQSQITPIHLSLLLHGHLLLFYRAISLSFIQLPPTLLRRHRPLYLTNTSCHGLERIRTDSIGAAETGLMASTRVPESWSTVAPKCSKPVDSQAEAHFNNLSRPQWDPRYRTVRHVAQMRLVFQPEHTSWSGVPELPARHPHVQEPCY